MKLLIVAPSGTGKTTAHEKGLSYDVESHPEYEKRADHYDWGTGDPKLKDIRNEYWHAFTEGAIESNLPSVSTHHSRLVDEQTNRRVIACLRAPTWEMVNDEKFSRSRLVAMAMSLHKIAIAVVKNELENVVEGFVSDLATEMKIKPVEKDELLLEEERIFHSIHAKVSALDEKHGYRGGH